MAGRQTMVKPITSEMPDVFADPSMRGAREALGLFFERFGLRRNVGRVWAVVYLSPDPLDQARIQVSLDLSAGLVSAALKELEHYGAVRPLSLPGERRTFYEAEDRLLRIVAKILAKRDVCAVRDLREAVTHARKHAPKSARDRLRQVELAADLYEALTKLVVKVSGMPGSAVLGITRMLKSGRFWRVTDND
jgi:DNA-binding transcriptional regulator GbsR (MarR family)